MLSAVTREFGAVQLGSSRSTCCIVAVGTREISSCRPQRAYSSARRALLLMGLARALAVVVEKQTIERRGWLDGRLGLFRAHVRTVVVCIEYYVRKMRLPTGIGDDAETWRCVMRNPRGFFSSCPRAKKLKRLATRDTPHGSRPNLDDSDRRVRVVPTSLAFSLTVRVRGDMPENKVSIITTHM